MERLTSRIIWMSAKINKLITRIKKLEKQLEEKKRTKPYSKVKQPIRMGNADWIYKDGYWKIYAVYKDEEEEEE